MTSTSVWLHVGLPKTGTTILQDRMFNDHPEIHFLGRLGGRDPKSGQAWTNGILRDLAKARPRDKRPFGPAPASLIAPDRVNVLSWEELTMCAARPCQFRAKALRDLFERARILFVLRKPQDLVESAYCQFLYDRNYGGLGGGPFYIDFDSWFDVRLQDRNSWFIRYADTLRLYAELFQYRSIRIALYEDLVRDPPGFVAGIASSMGIDWAHAARSVSRVRHNPRLDAGQINEIARIAGGWFGIVWRLLGKRGRKFWLPKPEPGAPAMRNFLRSEQFDRLAERTRAGNRWIQESFGVDLETRGYPL